MSRASIRRAGRGALVLAIGVCAAAFAQKSAGTAPPSPPPGPPPLEVFGRLPAMRLVTLSPNGQLVAMEEQQPGGVRQVTIFDVDAGKTRHTVAIDAANKLRDLAWADDETLLLGVSIMHSSYCNPNVLCQYEWFRTLAVRMDGSPPRTLLNDDGAKKYVSGSRLLAARTATPGVVTMATMDYSFARQREDSGTNIDRKDRDKSGWSWVVFAVDTRTGKEKLLATGTPYTEDWVVDAAGLPVARSEWQPDLNVFTVYVRQGERWKDIFKLQDGTQLYLAGLDLAGKAIVALGANGTNRSQAWSIPLDGSPVTSLHADPQLDVDVALFDENRNAVVGVQGTSQVATHWFDPKFASQEKSLQNAFKGLQVTVLDRSVVGRRVLVEVDSPSHPPVYQLVDFEKGRADIVAEAYPGLNPAALGAVSQIRYLARDGTPIPALLTLPPGKAAKDLPVVILPHGGPEWRDSYEFDWLPQFLATRGYAVLQPQFRGSEGWGQKLWRAGDGQWGQTMQDDKDDGVKWLIDQKIAAPDRVAMFGYSYGGYAALAAAIRPNGLYQCAISGAGAGDLASIKRDTFENRFQREFQNPTIDGLDPLKQAREAKIPLFIYHGDRDQIVDVKQSRRFVEELKAAGKPHRYLEIKDAGHQFINMTPEMIETQMVEVEKYLNTECGPGGL